jgi:hypothetical protein
LGDHLGLSLVGPDEEAVAEIQLLVFGAAAAHVLLLAAFIAHDGPFSIEGLAITTSIPILLFAWIMQPAQAMRGQAQRRLARPVGDA